MPGGNRHPGYQLSVLYSVVKRLVASKPRLDSGVRRNDGQGEISSIYCAGPQSAITPP